VLKRAYLVPYESANFLFVARAYFYRVSYARPQGGTVQVYPNFEGSLLFVHTPFDAELPNLTWLNGKEAGQPCPHSKGVECQRSPILGFFYARTLCHKTTKFDVATLHMWVPGLVLGVNQASTPRGWIPALPNWVPFYLCN